MSKFVHMYVAMCDMNDLNWFFLHSASCEPASVYRSLQSREQNPPPPHTSHRTAASDAVSALHCWQWSDIELKKFNSMSQWEEEKKLYKLAKKRAEEWKNTDNVWKQRARDDLKILRNNILDYFSCDKDTRDMIASRLAEVSARDETCEVTTYQSVYKADYMLRPLEQHRIVLGYKEVREWQEHLGADIVSHWMTNSVSPLKCDVVFVLGSSGVWCIVLTAAFQSLNCLTSKYFD